MVPVLEIVLSFTPVDAVSLTFELGATFWRSGGDDGGGGGNGACFPDLGGRE